VYALLGFVVVPWVARAQISKLARRSLHREATVGKVTFNPFTLAATVSAFDLRDRDGAPLLAFDRLSVDLEARGVLRRAWRFREVRIDGPALHARILATGRTSIADLFEPPPQAEPLPPDSGMPRVIVDRLVVGGGRLDFEDATLAPPYHAAFEPLGLDLQDLTTIPNETGAHTVTARFLGGAGIRWTGRQGFEPLRFEGRIEVTDLALPRIWEYVGRGQPLEVREGNVEVSLDYLLERDAADRLRAELDNGTVTVSDLAVHPRGGDERWLGVGRLAARGVRAVWPDRTFAVGELRCESPHVLARLAEDGTLNWAAAAAPAAPAAGAAPPDGDGDAPPWTGRIGAIVVEGGAARLEDRTARPPVEVEISDVAVRLDGVSTDASAPMAVAASARLLGGAASARGTIAAAGPAADLEVALDALDLVPLQPYLAALPHARLAGGAAGAKGTVTLRPAPAGLRYEGAAWLTAVELRSDLGDRLLASRQVRADGVRFTSSPARVRVGSITVDGGFAKVHIDTQGTMNLARLGDDDTPASAAPAAATTATPLPVYIGTVRFRDASADFADESLILPFATKIHALTGTITDLATTGAAPARIALEGRVDETGFVSVDGTLRIADPLAATDVRVVFRSIVMDRLTPYAAEFAGYSIERGMLDVDIRYRIADRKLLGEHRVVATDLTLGGKVEGTEAGLAVRLAIALLKDKDGRIDLDVPVEGSVDSPEFAYRKVMWQAVKTILSNIVKAPFRALGRLFGRDEEDLELVAFEPGRSALIPPEEDKLTKFAAELARRGDLTIEIEGRFDAAADAATLRADALEALIEQRRVAMADAVAGDAGVLDAILEELATELVGAEAVAAERARFAPSPPAPPEGAVKAKKSARKKQPEPPPPATFDAAAFYDALRTRLLAAQKVDDADLAALGRARAQAIASALTASGAVEPSRVQTLDPAPVKRKKKADTGLVASEMTLTAPR
jgi:outer membrane protein OmpA-like peptidoglycan-associated protein